MAQSGFLCSYSDPSAFFLISIEKPKVVNKITCNRFNEYKEAITDHIFRKNIDYK